MNHRLSERRGIDREASFIAVSEKSSHFSRPYGAEEPIRTRSQLLQQ